ncbi:NACHT and WD repeat domain-containing protein 2-like [Tubulanus polymorphus]|uniref:NACHT and WD repeat domain-containing protein 2-like n=1 Tax=Tubulanus polymorphus TaxID=672921 RepID=UPI003DA34AE3
MDQPGKLHRDIITGNIDVRDIPDVQSKVIRVYLCSSSQDTVEERNILVETVYPKLREYAREQYGLEFQVVDLHWGVRDEIWHDGRYCEFALAQISICCETSVGPYFVAILGQKYGNWSLPRMIHSSTMEEILSALKRRRNKDTRDFPLLTDWYVIDENDVEKTYVLKNIVDVYPYIAMKEEPEKQAEALASWQETETALKRLIRKGVEYATTEGQMDDMQRHQLLMSDFDRELECCIMHGNAPEDSCLVFHRTIVDVKNYMNDERAAKFIDLSYNDCEEKIEVDTEFQDMLADTIEKKIPAWIPDENRHHFDVLWKYDDGINPDLHMEYLLQSAQIFKDKMTALIDRHCSNLKSRLKNASDDQGLYQHVLEHWHMTKLNSKNFYMREGLLEVVKDYIYVNTNQPLVLYGDVGVGTTSLTAKVQTEVVNWLDDFFIVSRYVALSASCTSLRDIMHSVCEQLSVILGRTSEKVPKPFKLLQEYFYDLLNSIPKEKTLLLFLDGIERLSPNVCAHEMTWLPETLKTNVKVIITTDPKRNGILENLRLRYKNESNYIEIRPLSAEECLQVVDLWLETEGRKLTDVQREVVWLLFRKCSTPSYMKLVLAMVKDWQSSYVPKNEMLPCDPTDWVNETLDNLENELGRAVVSRCIAYLTASNTGISDSELLDLLSLDDDVLSEIFHVWHPPVRRMPILPWLKIKTALSPVLTEKNVEGVTVTCWANDMYRYVVTVRYMYQSEFKQEIHRNMADYFLGIWNNRKKPFLLPESLIENQKLPFCAAEADRLVPSQPLVFGDESNTMFNRRKFDQVPQHLYLCGKMDELNRLVLFNYEWLYNKTKALSVHHTIFDLNLNPCVEATLVEEALKAAIPVIEENVNNMATELSGRLLSYYSTHENIRELIKQCDKTGLQQSAMIPTYSYHQKPGGALQRTLNAGQEVHFLALTSNDQLLMTKNREDSVVKIFDLATGEHQSTVDVSVGDMHVTPNGKYFVLVDHITKMVVKVHDAKTGDFIGQLIPANHISLKPREKFTMSRVCVSDDFVCVLVSSDISYLCIAEVSTCNFLQILGLDGRATVCEISPDSSLVMVNASTSILAYNLRILQHVGTAVYDSKPVAIAYTPDGNKAFWLDGNVNKITAMLMRNGVTDVSYRVVMEHAVTMDTVTHIAISGDNKYVLVRGKSTILVYDIADESIQTRCYRPFDIPKEFRLPRSTTVELVFTGAAFSRSNKQVIGTIFRNIYVWNIEDSTLLKTLQAPVGVITTLLVAKRHGQIITHQQGSENIHVWNIEDTIGNGTTTLDKMTHPIVDMQLTTDDRLCVVKCKNSDEIGIIDIATGALTDLLTHVGPVIDFTVTPDGQYVFVSIKATKACHCNKIWSVVDRSVIYEFGSIPAFAVSNRTSNAFYIFHQGDSAGGSYHIRKFSLDLDRVRESNFTNSVVNLLCNSFVTADDNYLIALSAEQFDGTKARYVNPTINIYEISDSDEQVAKLEESNISSEVLASLLVNFQRILHVRPTNFAYIILIIYVSYPEDDAIVREDSVQRGLVLFDVNSKMVNHVCENFFGPTVPIDHRLLFSPDLTYCIDFQSNIFDVSSGYFLRQLNEDSAQPWALAVGGKVVVFVDGAELYALRLEDGKEIVRCNVQSNINSIKVGSDERTVVIGCADGRVQSYMVIDEMYENRSQLIRSIPTRSPSSELKRTKSWDKIDDLTRCDTPSMRSGKTDKELLDEITPIPRFRPQSDTYLYLNPKSQSCLIM